MCAKGTRLSEDDLSRLADYLFSAGAQFDAAKRVKETRDKHLKIGRGYLNIVLEILKVEPIN